MVGHTTLSDGEIHLGRRFVHEGREYEIFDVVSSRFLPSAEAAPPAALPPRITRPWSHTVVADSLRETFDARAREGGYWKGRPGHMREAEWDAYEWRNRLDDQVPDDAWESFVGHVFYTQAEADAVKRFMDLCDPLIDELGQVSFEVYGAHPVWPEVAAAARAALETMRANQPS